MPAWTVPIRTRLGRTLACLCLALLGAACEGPTGGGDKAGGLDSLDAELGKNRLNRYDFLQGNILSTGHAMDLAIEGKGFFILRNQSHYLYFRRPAMFTQDAEGYLHLGNAQTRLQGIRLHSDQDPYPRIPRDSLPRADAKDLEPVRWPFDDIAPPRASTVVKLARNLDANALGKGSILYSQAFLHHAEPDDLLIGLKDMSGSSLGIKAGDFLTLSATSGGATVTSVVSVTPGFTLGNLATALTRFLRSDSVGAGLLTTANLVSAAESDGLRGALTLYGNTAPILNLQITSSRPVSGPQVTHAFAVPAEIPAGTTKLAVATEPLRAPALPSDRLEEAYDAQGNGLGLQAGDRISYSGAIGDDQAQNVTPTIYADGAGGTTLQVLIDKIRDNFKLPERDGTVRNNLSVSLNGAGTDDNIADGSLVIRGQPGLEFSIKDVSIRSLDLNNAKPSPNFFNTNLNITTQRDASDNAVRICTLEVFDALGKAHRLSLTFIPSNLPGSWLWEASVGGEAALTAGKRGTVQFGNDGSVSAFAAEGGDARLEFDPGNGAPSIELALDAGGPGDFTGLTQFSGATTAAMTTQDGFPAGRLLSIDIGEDGVITGAYSNGQARALFRLPLADFPNRHGLRQVGENTFLETPESGKAVMSASLDSAGGAIRAGAVEYLTEEERARVCGVYPDC